MIADTNVWADFFNGGANAHVDRFASALEHEEDIAVIPVVVTEILQGFRTDNGFERARRLLVSFPVIHPTLQCHVRAARLFRSLRRKGVTVRGAVDCIIAQTCLDSGAELVSPDGDFERIARHVPLRLWRP